MSHERIDLGKRSETRAEQYLIGLGYRLLERSYRTRFGEIDLIMLDGGMIAFVEVRSRTAVAFGLPEESVDREKQRKIGKVASAYLQIKKLWDIPVRFDVIAIVGTEIRHIPNAFSIRGYSI